MGATEKYPNAPIALVIVEVRHPPATPFAPAQRQLLKKALADVTPIGGGEQQSSVLGPAGLAGAAITRFTSRDQHLSVTYGNESISVESTSYPGWETFRSIVQAAIAARDDVAPVDGVLRIGLRYIDELRVPAEGEPRWEDWVKPEVLGPSRLAGELGRRVTTHQGLMSVADPSTSDVHQIRYGQAVGQAVANGPLLRKDGNLERTGPYFLIDIDGSWTAEGAIPEFDTQAILEVADRLHQPIGSMFENLITEKLRDEVLRAND